MKFVVDTSVAVKWFTIETRHELAKAILGAGDDLVAPIFAHAELANALWRKVRTQEIGSDQARRAIQEFPAMISLLPATAAVVELAYNLAEELSHSVYDCIFFSTALQNEGFLFLTDDRKFAEKLAIKGYADRVRRLSDGPIPLTFTDRDLGELFRLLQTSRETINFVASQTGHDVSKSGLKIHKTSDLTPAYESPSYVRLKRAVADFTSHQTQIVLAVAWLGRGYDGDDFDKLYLQAKHLASAPELHAAYIISQLGYLKAGIEKYQKKQKLLD